MGCCGKLKQIVTGYSNLVRGKRFEFTNERIQTCQKCEKKTWLTKIQYGQWLAKNGIKVLRNLKDLDVLPELPKRDYEKGKGLYCRDCKCFIPAKARVEENTCPKDRWRA